MNALILVKGPFVAQRFVEDMADQGRCFLADLVNRLFGDGLGNTPASRPLR